MDFYKIGLEVKLTELEDKFIKVQDYVRDGEGLAKYDEAMGGRSGQLVPRPTEIPYGGDGNGRPALRLCDGDRSACRARFRGRRSARLTHLQRAARRQSHCHHIP